MIESKSKSTKRPSKKIFDTETL